MQYASMQTLFDSLCQCMGSSPTLPHDSSDSILSPVGTSPENNGEHTTTEGNTKSSPNSRRTSRLELKDKQWDALFEAVSPTTNSRCMQTTTHKHGGARSPSSSPEGTPNRSSRERAVTEDGSPHLEVAQALAQAKQAANPSRYNMAAAAVPAAAAARDVSPTTAAGSNSKSQPRSSSKSHKRKRPSTSRDDIFRSRKLGPTVRRSGCNSESHCMNPISKFLSNHQGFANALCFATPVRDVEEEEEELREEDHHDNNSLASDTGTLNTCEDSMLMLDNKLAQMSKNQPPMPLFHDFKVNQEPEGLRRIVDAETHNNSNLMQMWREQRHGHDTTPLNGGGIIIPSSSSSSSSSGGGGGGNRGRARVRYPQAPAAIPEDNAPPSMKVSSSGSSSRSSRSRHAPQTGEI